MIEQFNIGGYFELMAGFIGIYLGIKGFREEFYLDMKEQIAKVKSIREGNTFVGERSQITYSKPIDQLNDNELTNLKNEYDKYLKRFEELFTKRIEYVTNLKIHLKVTFTYSFVFCLFVILYIGFSSMITNYKLAFEIYLFFLNILILNSIVFLKKLFNIKDKYTITGLRYFIGLIILFILNYFVGIYIQIELTSLSILTLSVILPISPFLFHLIIEFVYFKKSDNQINRLLKLKNEIASKMTIKFIDEIEASL